MYRYGNTVLARKKQMLWALAQVEHSANSQVQRERSQSAIQRSVGHLPIRGRRVCTCKDVRTSSCREPVFPFSESLATLLRLKSFGQTWAGLRPPLSRSNKTLCADPPLSLLYEAG